MQTMRQTYPDFDYEPLMRPYAIDLANGKAVKPPLDPGAGAPLGYRLAWLPRIRCNDCPGKLYTAVPGKVIEDFDVHLRNRAHLAAVQRRQQQQEGR